MTGYFGCQDRSFRGSSSFYNEWKLQEHGRPTDFWDKVLQERKALTKMEELEVSILILPQYLQFNNDTHTKMLL